MSLKMGISSKKFFGIQLIPVIAISGFLFSLERSAYARNSCLALSDDSNPAEASLNEGREKIHASFKQKIITGLEIAQQKFEAKMKGLYGKYLGQLPYGVSSSEFKEAWFGQTCSSNKVLRDFIATTITPEIISSLSSLASTEVAKQVGLMANENPFSRKPAEENYEGVTKPSESDGKILQSFSFKVLGGISVKAEHPYADFGFSVGYTKPKGESCGEEVWEGNFGFSTGSSLSGKITSPKLNFVFGCSNANSNARISASYCAGQLECSIFAKKRF